MIEQYRTHIYHTVYAVLRNEKDAEDAAQEALIKIFYALPAYQEQGLKTWLTRIAVNHAIDVKRKAARQVEQSMEGIEITGSEKIEEPLMQREFQQHVRERMKELPDNYREVVQSFYIDEKTYKQIAAEQKLAEKTVEMKLYRARLWMRKHWKEEEFQ